MQETGAIFVVMMTGLLADAELGEDHAQKIVRGGFSDDFSQSVSCQSQFLGCNIKPYGAADRVARKNVQVLTGACQAVQMTGASKEVPLLAFRNSCNHLEERHQRLNDLT